MRIYLATVLLALSSIALAAESDASSAQIVEKSDPYQQVCEAATESKEAAKKAALELDIGRRELSRILCNELSVMEFAKVHSELPRDWAIATVQ